MDGAGSGVQEEASATQASRMARAVRVMNCTVADKRASHKEGRGRIEEGILAMRGSLESYARFARRVPLPMEFADHFSHISDIASTSHVTITSSGNVMSARVLCRCATSARIFSDRRRSWK